MHPLPVDSELNKRRPCVVWLWVDVLVSWACRRVVEVDNTPLIACWDPCQQVEGKKVLHVLISGGSLPAHLKDNAAAKSVMKLARWLRWLACSMLPDVYTAIMEKKLEQGKSPEASCFATWWQGVESHIMDTCVSMLVLKNPPHLSLHFDGVRVSKSVVDASDVGAVALLGDMEAAVLQKTGYRIELTVKEHLRFLDLVNRKTRTEVCGFDTSILGKPMNAIPMALSFVLGDKTQIAGLFKDTPDGTGLRAYREVAAATGVTLVPMIDPKLTPGSWLVHSEHNGLPHCTGVTVDGTGSTCMVYAYTYQYAMPMQHFRDLVQQSLDEKTMVFFYVHTGAGAAPPSKHDALLDLMAGNEV